MAASENEKSRLDEAARAGWLYFIAGHTQDEIAKMLQVSRASAQRLVSLCLAERLITFRLEHPIAACMELAARLKDLFHLVYCEVVPTDPGRAACRLPGLPSAPRTSWNRRCAPRSRRSSRWAPGRAVRAAVERVSPIDCPNHQIVSLVGNISADGSASFFDTVGRLADRTRARHYPMPLPFLMSSEGERDQMLRIDPIAKVRAVAAKADLRLVGIGQMDQQRASACRRLRLARGTVRDDAAGRRRRVDRLGIRCQGPHHQGRHQPPAHQHSAAGPGRSPDHRGRRRSCQGSGDQGGAEGTPDQRADHRRGDGKRHPEAVNRCKR